MLDRQTLRLRLKHQCRLLPFNVEQIAGHLGFSLLARFMRQCGSIVGLGIDFSIEPLDQSIPMKPCNQCDGVHYLSERK